MWNLAGSVAAPIFEGGKIKAENKQAEARYREALANYQKTVQLAFKEALDALNSNQMYRQIYDSYLAQTLLSAEMNLATARNNELDAVVDLAKALGGGWTRQDMKDTAKK